MGWHRNFPIVCKIVGSGAIIHFSRLFLHTARNRYIDSFLKINCAAFPIFLSLIIFIPIQQVNAISNLSLVPSLLVLIGFQPTSPIEELILPNYTSWLGFPYSYW